MKATDDLLARIAERLKALADPMRLKILHTLEAGEMRVTDILAVVGTSQANLSKHLAVLRRAGLVSSRRDSMSVYYRVADETAFAICRLVCDGLVRLHEAERAALRPARRTAARGG